MEKERMEVLLALRVLMGSQDMTVAEQQVLRTLREETKGGEDMDLPR